ncbi:beta-alanine--pyruvate transaminase [Pseudomonas sp. ok272]|uniref:aminotransferase class III-fold pyridoxal phosphate-dependent enzyme n=1 Tax=unclassified Pseudomonas TaxID=196821 RepID=UPI0008BD2314|nr:MULTISPECIES: aminotransferase class III-fold pyridoxal phosphate-dependent enzyme [unclassified Pseudomonas]SEN23850.1 beta-alanine--pyruvate transaminase [Pseudomonas sp. ok272]SFN15030.1 beta-alanine--pyruvate transaminase [Pseudomonas sp. ok602]
MNTPLTQAQLNSYFIGFTPNPLFKLKPRLIVGAQGSYLHTSDGKKVFDGFSGLWCSGMGHGHPKIVEAVQKQVAQLDYVSAFYMSHPAAFTLTEKIAALAPDPLNHVFYTTGGSDAVDSALKLALGYHRLKGNAGRTRMIGRERGYHGVGFGGISVGGMVGNRKMFSTLTLPGVDHLPHTYSHEHMAFTQGQPTWGAHLADDLERLVALHDASNIAAVIVEPMAGSTGVLVPPVGYLQRLRDICTRHGILLIFDEVICGFGRMGANFAAQRFGVVPDMITFAKTVTNGTQPLGGVIMSSEIYNTFMDQPEFTNNVFHGYTYSAHPVAVAAGLAALEVFSSEGVADKVREKEQVFQALLHSLKDEPNVIDIRNIGFSGSVEFASIPGQPGIRGHRITEALYEAGYYLRWSGDQAVFAPPFDATVDELESLVEALRTCIRANA